MLLAPLTWLRPPVRSLALGGSIRTARLPPLKSDLTPHVNSSGLSGQHKDNVNLQRSRCSLNLFLRGLHRGCSHQE